MNFSEFFPNFFEYEKKLYKTDFYYILYALYQYTNFLEISNTFITQLKSNNK